MTRGEAERATAGRAPFDRRDRRRPGYDPALATDCLERIRQRRELLEAGINWIAGIAAAHDVDELDRREEYR